MTDKRRSVLREDLRPLLESPDFTHKLLDAKKSEPLRIRQSGRKKVKSYRVTPGRMAVLQWDAGETGKSISQVWRDDTDWIQCYSFALAVALRSHDSTLLKAVRRAKLRYFRRFS